MGNSGDEGGEYIYKIILYSWNRASPQQPFPPNFILPVLSYSWWK